MYVPGLQRCIPVGINVLRQKTIYQPGQIGQPIHLQITGVQIELTLLCIHLQRECRRLPPVQLVALYFQTTHIGSPAMGILLPTHITYELIQLPRLHAVVQIMQRHTLTANNSVYLLHLKLLPVYPDIRVELAIGHKIKQLPVIIKPGFEL